MALLLIRTEVYYQFDFFDFAPTLLPKESYWFRRAFYLHPRDFVSIDVRILGHPLLRQAPQSGPIDISDLEELLDCRCITLDMSVDVSVEHRLCPAVEHNSDISRKVR